MDLSDRGSRGSSSRQFWLASSRNVSQKNRRIVESESFLYSFNRLSSVRRRGRVGGREEEQEECSYQHKLVAHTCLLRDPKRKLAEISVVSQCFIGSIHRSPWTSPKKSTVGWWCVCQRERARVPFEIWIFCCKSCNVNAVSDYPCCTLSP